MRIPAFVSIVSSLSTVIASRPIWSLRICSRRDDSPSSTQRSIKVVHQRSASNRRIGTSQLTLGGASKHLNDSLIFCEQLRHTCLDFKEGFRELFFFVRLFFRFLFLHHPLGIGLSLSSRCSNEGFSYLFISVIIVQLSVSYALYYGISYPL